MDIVIKGIGLGLLLSVAVGPVVFAILKVSMKLGHKAGYAFVLGVSASDVLLVVFSNLAAELVKALLRYEFWIAFFGAALLLIMGIYGLFFGKDPRDDPQSDIQMAFRRRDLARFGLQGFFMNLLTPGPILFWLTTCTAFAYLPLHDRLMLFAACLATILMLDMGKVFFAGKIRNLLTPLALHRIHQASSLVLIVFALAIGIGIYLRYFQ
jgi:threonine/homoserine/homoserine lactone efflux protein